MNQKQCLIIVAILMGVALLWVGIYYGIKEYKTNHQTNHQVVCRIEQGWDCLEDVQECYEEMKNPYSEVDCPREDFACEPIEVEVCE